MGTGDGPSAGLRAGRWCYFRWWLRPDEGAVRLLGVESLGRRFVGLRREEDRARALPKGYGDVPQPVGTDRRFACFEPGDGRTTHLRRIGELCLRHPGRLTRVDERLGECAPTHSADSALCVAHAGVGCGHQSSLARALGRIGA